MIIPFSPPDITEAEINEVVSVLKSKWITTGKKTKQFQNDIAEYVSTDYCLCLNSQTACSEMLLRAIGVGEGDEIITSAYTYTASASVIAHTGAKIVLVDVQKDSTEMDYEALENAITEKTKAIIPVDVAGIPCDYDRIFDIVNKKKGLFKPASDIQKAFGRIIVLADTAHSLGAEYKGKRVGTVADFSSFSFHAVKNLTTAEGGALTWNKIKGIDNEAFYSKIQTIALHGQSKDALSKMKAGAWEYDIESLGYKHNMTDVLAAIGIVQLERYPEMLDRRKTLIKKYDERLNSLGVWTLEHYNASRKSSGHLYFTRVPNVSEAERNEIVIKMAERGIACNVHYKPLPMFTAYKNIGFDIKDYPNAFDLYYNEITLPLNTCITDEEAEYILSNYIEVLKEYI